MNNCRIILILLGVLSSRMLFGQSEYILIHQPFENPFEYNKGVYLQGGSTDSNGYTNVYLVNHSNDTIKVYSKGLTVHFTKEVLDESGNWMSLERNLVYCGTGNGYGLLPPDSYTYTSVLKPLSGRVETLMRYSLEIEGLKIFTNPETVKIDQEYFFGKLDVALLNSIEYSLSRNATSRKDSVEIKLLKVYELSRLGELERAIEECRTIEEAHGLTDNLILAKARVYLKYCNLISSRDSLLVKVLVSAAVAQVEKITSVDQRIVTEKERILRSYYPYLLTHAEMLEVELECELDMDGVTRCFISGIINEWLELKIKKGNIDGG